MNCPRLKLFCIVAASVLLGSYARAAALGTTPAWSYDGTLEHGILGDCLVVTDVNGDGFDDLVVGQPNSIGAGQVLVFLGGAGGPSTSPDQILTGSEPDFATTLSGAGDWNGDGYQDVAVGSSFNSVGSISIYFGAPSGLSPFPSWTATGTGSFGQIVAAAGDVNGDGFGDVLTADFFATVGPLSDAGRAFLYLGGPGASTSPAWSFDGDAAGGLLGAALNGAGDVNGDGYDDIIVGEVGSVEYQMQHNKLVQIHSGKAFVFLGSASGPALTPAWVTAGPIDSAYGWAVGSAGDVNSDGFAEVFVSANQASVKIKGGGGMPRQTGSQRGIVYVYYGSSSGPAIDASWTVVGDLDGANLGNDLASGDFNHDGYSDLAISAPKRMSPGVQQGRLYAYLGGAAGLSTTAAWFVDGGQAGAGGIGFPMGTGRVNADLFDDLLVGAPAYDTAAGVDAGRADLYLGQAN